MNTQLVEALRQLNLQPGESYTIEMDGGTVEVFWRRPPEPGGPSPDPPGTVYRVVKFCPAEPPMPYRFDENDLAPGNLGDPDDLPGSST